MEPIFPLGSRDLSTLITMPILHTLVPSNNILNISLFAFREYLSTLITMPILHTLVPSYNILNILLFAYQEYLSTLITMLIWNSLLCEEKQFLTYKSRMKTSKQFSLSPTEYLFSFSDRKLFVVFD